MNNRLFYEFEGFRLDTHSQTLISPTDEKHILLKPKEFEVLLFFVEHAGELLDKETLLRTFWPGQTVEENNLNQYITALRKILGEERGGRRFIMNVRAQGYRFVPDVLQLKSDKVVADSSSGSAIAPTENRVAWQCFQHASFLRNEDRPDRWCEAVKLFERAIDLDSNFASAYAHLALTRILLLMLDHPGSINMLEQAEYESRLAVKLRPGVADGYMALGAIDAACGRWVEAELNFLAARKLDDEWLLPINMHSVNVLLSAGHVTKALDIGRETLRDVEGVTSLATMQFVVCLLANKNEEAEKALQLAIAMGAQTTCSPMADALSLMAQRKGDYNQAAEVLIPSLSSHLIAAGGDSVIRQVLTALQNDQFTAQTIEEVKGFVARIDFDTLPQTICRQILLWYTQLGALDEAFDFSNQILNKYEYCGSVGTAWGSLWLQEMSLFRRDPRFTMFVTRMQLPDYWKTFGPPDGYLWENNQLLDISKEQ